MAESNKQKPKKPYQKPTLIIYGTVRDITQSIGNMGAMDGGVLLGKRKSHL
jgi:hypothetical protein